MITYGMVLLTQNRADFKNEYTCKATKSFLILNVAVVVDL